MTTKTSKLLTEKEKAVLEAAGYAVLHLDTPERPEVCRVTCGRCGGTGHYSYCQMYGTTCFECHGNKTVLEAARRTYNRLKKLAADARKAERMAVKAAADEAAHKLALGDRVLVTEREVLDETHRLKLLRAAEAKARADAEVAAGNGWLLAVLDGNGDFERGIREKLTSGAAVKALSPKCLGILCDMYAKRTGGNRGSKAYEAACDEFARLSGVENVTPSRPSYNRFRRW